MKHLLLLALFGLSTTSFSQIEGLKTIDPEGGGAKGEKKVLLCRDPRFRMVSDCDGLVYSEKRTIAGKEEDIVFHQRSGAPFTGQCKVCHNNGNLWMFLDFNNGRSKGADTVWYDDGKTELIRAHDTTGQGLEHGTWKYYRPDGSLKWEKNYEMGMAHGEHRHYFEDSTLHKIEIWKYDQLNGKKQEFYKGGQIKKEVEYKNGKWNGTYITYFEDGKVESEQVYSNDKKEGPSTYYFESGEIFYTENHEGGKREGEFKRFYRSGMKFTVETYKNDLRHGNFEEYYDDEKNLMKYQATYKKGEVVEEHYYDEFGDETSAPGGTVVEGGDDAAKDIDKERKKKEKKKKDKKKKDKDKGEEEE
mgnify:CR=1 FL=1